MDRRTFFTWTWLGLLVSASPIAIGGVINQSQYQPALAFQPNDLEHIFFYVASNGNDTWSGKQEQPNSDKTDGPFATLQKARDTIRELKHLQGNTLERPVTVLVRSGTYFLVEPLVFTAEDSGTADFPIAYQAYPNEKPVISGGRPITGWQKQGDLWVANLPDVKTGQWHFRLLRVGDNWAIRARYPNFDPDNPLTGGWLFARDDRSNRSGFQFGKDYIVVDSEHFPNWQNWEGAELYAYKDLNWANSILPVTKVDKNNYTLFGNFKEDEYPIALGNRFFIENVREALDSPGEWYLDTQTGELLYWPTASDVSNYAEIVAPITDKLIVLQGDMLQKSYVEHIHFRGLTFTDTDYSLAKSIFATGNGAIELSAVRQCVIEDCTFIMLGAYGIQMNRRSHENQIISNKMSQLGEGGVTLEGDVETQPFNNLFAGNDIRDIGKIYKWVYGISVYGHGNTISHNRFQRMTRSAIDLSSDGINTHSHHNIVEFNEIIDACQEVSDGGAIGNSGRDRQLSGNIIRYNFIKNVNGILTDADGNFSFPFMSWGIYLDDYTSGTLVYGNIVTETAGGALYIHGGIDNKVENNIFVDGVRTQVLLEPHSKDPQFMKNNIIRRNIVFYKEPNKNLFLNYENWRRDLIKECNFNLYWCTGGLDLGKTAKAITPEGNLAQWQVAGFDRNSLIADPQFVAPKKEDFRLQHNSPAFQLGFQPIPVELIGIEGFNVKEKY
jgi:parallel beta-helix repeat protein